jgi:fumarate reductase flavoprotein subunit
VKWNKIGVLILAVLLLSMVTASIGHAKTIKLESDILVIGCGGSGLAAALTAVRGGARVIAFEKMPSVGGSANFAEGIFGVESEMQRRMNISITKDQAFKMHMKHTHWRADPRLVRAIINKSGNTIDWLEEQGIEFMGVAVFYPGAPWTWHTIKGFGAGLIRPLYAKAKEEGVTIYLETQVRSIIYEKNRVCGVVSQDKEGNTIQARAGAVIISSGGFAKNKDMLEKYTEAGHNLMAVGNPGKLGDGIRMAWEVGAAAEGTEVLQLAIPGVRGQKGFTNLTAVLSQPYLWINQLGKRFFDEGTHEFPFVGNAIAKQKDQIMYVIYDENTKKHMIEKGIDFGVGIHIPPATKLESLDNDIQRGIAMGEVFVADSPEEVAAKIDVDKETLKETVAEYNKFCDQRHDDLFAKDPKYLHPVRTQRFYAHRGYLTFVGTLGGIKVNHKMEVLNKDSESIPGLYATGNCAGGMYGDSYNDELSGLTLAFAVNSGRIAAENALKFICN